MGNNYTQEYRTKPLLCCIITESDANGGKNNAVMILCTIYCSAVCSFEKVLVLGVFEFLSMTVLNEGFNGQNL